MRRIFATLLLLLIAISAGAQEAPPQEAPPTGVHVTTQDIMSLRAGPGRGFARLAVVPEVVTLPAYGRTSDTRWIQVMYEGQYGWILAQYLVWTGDMIALPVDGVTPAPFIRRAAALGFTTRETPYYRTTVTPEEFLGFIPAGTEVELTGRVGEEGFFRFQVRYNDQLVWVGSWDIRVTDGDYRRLLDLAYTGPYGRLILGIERNIAQALGSYNQAASIWERLSRGERLACQQPPPRVGREVTDTDVNSAPQFLPAVRALDSAIRSINGAISAYEDACANITPLTGDLVDAQLAEIDNAERNLLLAGSLLEPLRRRNPLLGQ
jgi:hypothetical protein